MLYSREKAKLKKAREKARLKREMNKNLNAERTEDSYHDDEIGGNASSPALTGESLLKQSTIDTRLSDDIYLDPFDIKESFDVKNYTR